MNFNMVRPCAHCPFRNDIPGYLHGARAREIAEAITERQMTFSCHETTTPDEWEDNEEIPPPHVPGPDEEHCAGAAILLERIERPNQWMRISERLGFYDRTKLDMAAPVFQTAEEFIRHHARK